MSNKGRTKAVALGAVPAAGGIAALEELLPRPRLLPDEDPQVFAGFRAALIADLAPRTAYQRNLAEQLAGLEWDAIRQRRLRDTLVRTAVKRHVLGMQKNLPELQGARGKVGTTPLATALLSDNPALQAGAWDVLAEAGFDREEIVAECWRECADDLELFDRKLGDLERRRERSLESYRRLQEARRHATEDAETVEAG